MAEVVAAQAEKRKKKLLRHSGASTILIQTSKNILACSVSGGMYIMLNYITFLQILIHAHIKHSLYICTVCMYIYIECVLGTKSVYACYRYI